MRGIASVLWGYLQDCGGCSVQQGITSVQYCGGYSVQWGDTFSTLEVSFRTGGDYISTAEGMQGIASTIEIKI